jgi:hypothetical protein
MEAVKQGSAAVGLTVSRRPGAGAPAGPPGGQLEQRWLPRRGASGLAAAAPRAAGRARPALTPDAPAPPAEQNARRDHHPEARAARAVLLPAQGLQGGRPHGHGHRRPHSGRPHPLQIHAQRVHQPQVRRCPLPAPRRRSWRRRAGTSGRPAGRRRRRTPGCMQLAHQPAPGLRRRRFVYESAMPVGRLVKQVADKHQVNTQRSWCRPYGVGLLVAGHDTKGPHLYNTCPSGNYYEYKAHAIGARSQVLGAARARPPRRAGGCALPRPCRAAASCARAALLTLVPPLPAPALPPRPPRRTWSGTTRRSPSAAWTSWCGTASRRWPTRCRTAS